MTSLANMADSAKEKKLAVARNKLRKFQKKKTHSTSSSSPLRECVTPDDKDLTPCCDYNEVVSTESLSSGSSFADLRVGENCTLSLPLDDDDLDGEVLLSSKILLNPSESLTKVTNQSQTSRNHFYHNDYTAEMTDGVIPNIRQGYTTSDPREILIPIGFVENYNYLNPSEVVSFNNLENPITDECRDIFELPVSPLGSCELPQGNSVDSVTQNCAIPVTDSFVHMNQDFLPVEYTNRQQSTESVSASTVSNQTPLLSASESLRQISLQMNGLMREVEIEAPGNSVVLELERRNSELAASLQREMLTSQQHSKYIHELKSQLATTQQELETSLANLKSTHESSGIRELTTMKDQLQVHVRTIGILVAEKADLQTSLTHCQLSFAQKTGELSQFEARLNATRMKLNELESTLRDANARLNLSANDNVHLQKQNELLQAKDDKNSKMCDELRTSVIELSERLMSKSRDCDQLERQLANKKSQLSMARLNLQQLRDSTNEDLQAQLQQLQAAQVDLLSQLQGSQTALSDSHSEISRLTSYYQNFTEQLSKQLDAFKLQNEHLIMERDQLVTSLSATSTKLSQLMTSAQKETSEVKTTDSNETINCDEHFEASRKENETLKQQLELVTRDNSHLSQLLMEQSQRVESLELQADRVQTGTVDTSQLLVAMQSDKVAAARALTQNKQLKEQLQELETGFIQMSNKKLELTEKIEKELHNRKSLNLEVSQIKEQMIALRQQLADKDEETRMLKGNCLSLGEQLMSARSASLKIAPRSNEVNNMNNHTEMDPIKDQLLPEKENEVQVTSGDDIPIEDSVEAHLDEPNLEAESKLSENQMAKQTSNFSQDFELKEDEDSKVQQSQRVGAVSWTDFIRLQRAHEALEGRFRSSMEQVAELSDDKQRLEHLVAQLQVETETVGDYITIYQFQRGVMRQQVKELQRELDSLRRERVETKLKLATLQDLVSALAVGEGKLNLSNGLRDVIQATTEGIDSPGPSADNVPSDGELEQPMEFDSPHMHPPVKFGDTIGVHGSLAKGKGHATVRRILDLIHEMESVNPQESVDFKNFHHCPLCSGKMITI